VRWSRDRRGEAGENLLHTTEGRRNFQAFSRPALEIVGLLWLAFSLLLEVAWAELRTEYHLDITVQEQYDDNLTLSSENPQRDFITTISPGGQLLLDYKTGKLFLDYHLNGNIYAGHRELDYVGHQARVDFSHSIVRNLTFRFLDNFILSDEPREVLVPEQLPPPEAPPSPEEYRIGTRVTRSRYIRNALSPELEWRYGKSDFVALKYRDEIYRNDEDSSRDSTRDTFGVRGEHWFSSYYGLGYDVSYTKAHFVTSSDFQGQDGIISLKRRLTPHTLLYIQGGLTSRDFLEGETVDYTIYRGSLGAEHSFTKFLSGTMRVGAAYFSPELGKSEVKPEGDASITLRWERFRGSAFVRGGYIESYGDAENLGLGTYYAMGAAFHYFLLRHLYLALDGSMGWYDFPSSGKRTIWQVRPSVNWQVTKWLSATVEYRHLEQTATKASEYTNNKFFFRITARY